MALTFLLEFGLKSHDWPPSVTRQQRVGDMRWLVRQAINDGTVTRG